MTNIYLYADETGNLDYDGSPNPHGGGASTYFGFGTATFTGDHGAHLLEGLHLRAAHEKAGTKLPNGFHACNDSHRTRSAMFRTIQNQRPRFDTTFLYKKNAYDSVKQQGGLYLYKLAWFQHMKTIARQVASPDDDLYVITAEFGTKRIHRAVDEALQDVCAQIDRNITLCVWRSASSWGLQVADYGLWATQRVLEGRTCSWFAQCIEPTLESVFTPWGRAH